MKYRLGTVSKSIFLEGLNQFHLNNFQNTLPSDFKLLRIKYQYFAFYLN